MMAGLASLPEQALVARAYAAGRARIVAIVALAALLVLCASQHTAPHTKALAP